MVEGLLLSSALTTSLFGLGFLIYIALVHIGMNYLLHEFLVCKNTRGESHCEKVFRRKTGTFLVAGRLLRLETQQNVAKTKARVLLELPLEKKMELRKELRSF